MHQEIVFHVVRRIATRGGESRDALRNAKRIQGFDAKSDRWNLERQQLLLCQQLHRLLALTLVDQMGT